MLLITILLESLVSTGQVLLKMCLRNTAIKSTTNTNDAEQTENNVLNPGIKSDIQENLLVFEE